MKKKGKKLAAFAVTVFCCAALASCTSESDILHIIPPEKADSEQSIAAPTFTTETTTQTSATTVTTTSETSSTTTTVTTRPPETIGDSQVVNVRTQLLNLNVNDGSSGCGGHPNPLHSW